MISPKMCSFSTWTLLLFWFIPAHATSIVALVEANRILLAADSRVSGEIADDKLRDKACKIVVMNDDAFANNGFSRIRDLGDNSIVWDGPALGREAYLNHNGNVLDAANEWAERSFAFFTSFLSNAAAVDRTPPGNLADYDVAGFSHNPDRPQLVIASIGFDPTGEPGRRTQRLVVSPPPRTEPYSSNPVTRELIAGQTERAKATLATWQLKVTKIKRSDQDRRFLEYLIQQTAKYDDTVNDTVNVLQITANQKPLWLQHPTCP
jgi:hypothetical protein